MDKVHSGPVGASIPGGTEDGGAAKRLKVFGGCFDGTTRNIVAARTKKEAAAAFGVTPYNFNQYACDTGNDLEVSIATAEPGVPFSAPESGPDREVFVRGLARYRRGQKWPPNA